MPTREQCLTKLRETVRQGQPLLGVGAGTGISAKFAEAGADVLVAHMGLTTKGSIGARTALTLERAAERVQAIRDAGVAVNADVLVICHGGPIAEPEDARFILGNTRGVHGFFGASSIERLAVERAVTEQTRAFKQILRR